jgi:hypothetical protein
MIVILAALLLCAPAGTVEGQNPTYFTVNLTGQSLTAGFNNNVTVTATNSYTSSTIYPSNQVYDADLAVSIPAPLQMLGDNHWHYDSIMLHQSVTVSFQVYAPTAAIGSSYQGSITLTYRQLGEISYTQETHDIGFSVNGWISLVLYGMQVTPSSAPPGGNATVSGNLLNNGNLAAFNANVTVQSETISQSTVTSLYMGEVDPNIPRPFSFLVHFKENLPDGNYSISVVGSAVDTNRPSSPYSAHLTAPIQIKKAPVRPATTGRQTGGLIGMIFEILRNLWSLFFGLWSLPTPVWFANSYSKANTAYMLDMR